MRHNTLQKINNKNTIFVSLLLYVIAVTIGLNNIVIGYKLAGVSIDRIIQIIIFLILFKNFMHDLKNKNLKVVIYIIGIFLILNVFNNFSLLMQGEEKVTLAGFTRDTIRILMYGIFTYLSYYLFKKDINKINIILFIQFLAILLAFFQNPLTPLTEWSQMLKMSLFSKNMIAKDMDIYSSFLGNVNRNFMRVSGPYGQVVTLSYTLVISAILAAYMNFTTKNKLYLYYILFVLIVSIMSLTRSSFGAILVILLYLASQRKKFLFGLLFVGFLYTVFFSNFDISNLDNYTRVVSTDDSSAQGKIPLWITGITTILLHPFGITEVDYTNVKQWMYMIIPNQDILKYPAHNGIINLGFQYTVFGLFLFIYFIYVLFKISKLLKKNERRFWFFAFFAYLFQQSFHNNGIFYVEFNVLIVLALYLVNIDNHRKLLGDNKI